MCKTIFHLDDDADDRGAVKMILEKEDYIVKSFENSNELFDSMTETHPDLVILDVMLEEHDSGLKLHDRILKKYPKINMILLTALGKMVSTYFKNQSAHVWVVEKPILPRNLISAVQLNLR